MSARSRKQPRTLAWTPEANSVACRVLGVIEVTVTDPAEPDRRITVQTTADDSVYLAARIAQLTGHKLVQA